MSVKLQTTTKAGGTNGRFTEYPDMGSGPSIICGTDQLLDQEPTPYDGQDFDVHHCRWSGGVIDRAYTGYWEPYFNNYTCDYLRNGNSDTIAHLITTAPNDSSVATTVVAATSPSRPNVDVPTMIGELADLPQLVKKLGDTMIEKMAALNLSYHFALKPLVSDLFKLGYFQDATDKRVKELERLKSRGLRRTIGIGQFIAEDVRDVVAQSVDAYIVNRIYRKTTEKVWGFCSWSPTGNFPQTDAKMREIARNAVLGLTYDMSTQWNLIPFTWLADWCGNVSEYLIAARNIVPAAHSPVQVMRHRTTRTWSYQWGPAPWNGVYMSPFECTQESKRRRTAIPAYNAQFPFLNERQLSILGSIGLLSGRNRR